MNKRSAEMYRFFSLLFSGGVQSDLIFEMLGIRRVYIYGAGEMGQIFLSFISPERVAGILDRKIEKKGYINISGTEYEACLSRDIVGSDFPIVITPSYGYPDILQDLLSQGISFNRILTLNVFLRYGMYFMEEYMGKNHPMKSLRPFGSKEFLITGANFENKGSQAMAFTVMDEIRKKYGRDSIIWLCPNYRNASLYGKKYRMITLDDGWDTDSVFYEVLPRLTAIIDVSGYALSSTKGFGNTERILEQLKRASDHNVPFYMFPQSFGPLEYQQNELKEMAELLSLASVIYAREDSGRELLEQQLGLTNVLRSSDMVLQSKGFDKDNIFRNRSDGISGGGIRFNGITVIPNTNLVRYIGEKETEALYCRIVSILRKDNEQVNIVLHSKDGGLCQNIYRHFINDPWVCYFDEDMDCIDFEQAISGCKYLIASRYHAVVHAYKEAVPCIVVGWADKYRELTELFGQEAYLIDVRDGIDPDRVICSVETMEKCYRSESEKIREGLKKVQKENCFDILPCKDIVFFGAQGYALGAYEAINYLFPARKVIGFLVSERGNNAEKLGGLPVYEISAFADRLSKRDRDDIEVLIATPENVQPEVELILDSYGLADHHRLDSDTYSELMGSFHQGSGRFVPVSALAAGMDRPFVKIYMARSHKDRPLEGRYFYPDYFCFIQAGAENTSERIAGILDNTGDNISSKNPSYSELTALYWLWKNRLCPADSSAEADYEYYGLAQYRRMLILSDMDLLRLKDNDIDVCLPYPMPYEPDIHAHHERYIKNADWEALLTALKELQPEYERYLPEALGQRYLYNYNVILAKKTVLREYCEWLFPILNRVEQLSDPRGNERADRYIGYMGETLETLYFMKNADRLNIVHTGCMMLV